MCGLCYTLLCVICATQDGDAGAIISPFFPAAHAQWRPRQGEGYESEIYKKTRETPVTLCFLLPHLHWSDPYRIFIIFTSCSLTHYDQIFCNKVGSYHSQIRFLCLGKPLHGEKSAREAFFEGLKMEFLRNETPIVFFVIISKRVKLQLVKIF